MTPRAWQTQTLLAALVVTAGAAQAQRITQTVPFDYDPSIDAAFPEFALFDTLGGTRRLTGLTLSYDQQISFDVQLEQNSPVAIEQGTFFADVTYISLHQLGPSTDGDDDDDGSGPPFLGPGAAGDVFEPALAPTDGFNGTGPDTFAGSVDTGVFTFTAAYDANEQAFLDAFTGQGTLSTVLAGFGEIFGGYNSDPGFPAVDPDNPPDGPFFPFQDPFYGVFVEMTNIRHRGTITAAFDFEIVPSPASATALSIAGLAVLRRRR